ncbi:MAG: nitroreductase family protein [Candidatus Methanomethyliales bacterium]|nr:nitroreductase family protein [Candidatus Methanomethylicales archaeon]
MDLIEAINTRAMVRDFLDQPLKEEEKQLILEAAIRAPTAGGNEQWYFLAVESKDSLEKLHKLLVDAQRVYFTEMLKVPWSKDQIEKWEKKIEAGLYKAPFYVAVFTDMRARYYTRTDVEERWAEQSAAAAIENMLLAAHGMGIGGCWFGVPLLMEDKFYEFFKVNKEEMRLVAVLAFGYPKQKPSPRQRKKSIKEVVRSL